MNVLTFLERGVDGITVQQYTSYVSLLLPTCLTSSSCSKEVGALKEKAGYGERFPTLEAKILYTSFAGHAHFVAFSVKREGHSCKRRKRDSHDTSAHFPLHRNTFSVRVSWPEEAYRF